MLSNLASYIFGGAQEESSLEGESPSSSTTTPGTDEDGWVLVGGANNNALNLGSLNEVPSSTVLTEDEEEETEEERASISEEASSSNGRLPLGRPNNSQVALVSKTKAADKAAQNALKKRTKKVLSAKTLERKNKAVKYSGSCKRQLIKHNFPIKSSGINKQLKQC